MASRNPTHSLPEIIHSLLGLKSHLNSSWVKSVCDIIMYLPYQGQSSDLRATNDETNNTSSDHRDDDDLDQATSNIRGVLATLTARINELNKQRRQVLNEFLDLKGNIRVLCRIRPITVAENLNHLRPVVVSDSSNVHVKLTDTKSKSYSFDKVFHPGSSQDQVFSEVEPVIKSALDGYNACIFAYGQTGTGKTFTMEGTPDFPGVVPCAIEALFKQAVDSNHMFRFSFSMLEIYMGNLKDLLILQPTKAIDPVPPCLSIQTDPKGGIEIENLVAIQVSDFKQALKLYKLGCRFRSTASTNCNATSSRSHCLIRISITCGGAPERRRETNKVWLVDLGGSERLLKTKAWGRRLEEGKAINLSLSSLGDVINALQIRKGHVPYRNSKLTQVLKDSLGKDSKTLMLVHISPKEEDLCETLCSLNFATRVRSVHLGNTDSTEEKEKEVAMINLQRKMKMIEVERQDVRMSIEKLNEELDKLARTAPSSSEQLDAYHFDELPQPNLDIKRNKTTNIIADAISQAPRFMRPTICSRRKSGSEHLTSEEKVRFPSRRKRPMNHHAKSVNFPVKSTSENNSECSISRNSCLVALTVKSSADLETEYSQDLSECDIKEVVYPEQKASPKCSNHHRDHSEGCENGNESNACSAEYLNVDKWLLLNKNVPATLSHSHRNKQVLAIPAPEKTHICNRQKGRDNFRDEKFHKYKFLMKQIVNHNKLEKHAHAEGSRSMQEVAVSKPPTNLENYVNIDSRCTADSPSDKIVEEMTTNIKDKLDDVPSEKHIRTDICPPDIWCSSFHSNQDDNGVITLSTMQALLGEKECSDSSLSTSRQWRRQNFISSLANGILDAREDSGISISRIELHSCCQQLPTAICGEDCEKEELDVSFQSSAEGIRPHLHKMRSQRAPVEEKVTPKEPIKPQRLIKSLENVMNSGICHLLQQKIQLLWASALLGLGFQNLGLEQEFFLGLML